MRNISLSSAKLLDAMLSLQVDYTMLKLASSIRVTMEEISYMDKVRYKRYFLIFSGTLIGLLVIEIIAVYKALDQRNSCLLNAITFIILAIVNVSMAIHLLSQLKKLSD